MAHRKLFVLGMNFSSGVPGFRPSGHIRLRLTESFVSAHAGHCPSRDQGRPSAGFVSEIFRGLTPPAVKDRAQA